jgi:hypothetical protein
MSAADLARGLQQLADALGDLSDADAQAAALIADAAPGFTPRRTGRLAAGFQTDGGTVTNREPYAGFVHDRHPFLTLAAESVDWSAPHVAAIADALDHLKGTY